MARYSKQEKYEYHMARIKRERNPFPNRTDGERRYVSRRLSEIADSTDHYLGLLASIESEPQWLHHAVITPFSESYSNDAKEYFESAQHDDDGYLIDTYDHTRKATNRIRIGSWYRNMDDNLYFTAMIAISPLPCLEWGNLPLTLTQWRILMPSYILGHMRWKWLHAVRKYWNDETYQVGGSMGWHLEPCKKLDKSEIEVWTGQVIYGHVVRKYLEHVES